MTTTPITTLTEELLAEIEEECALAAALDCNAAITPEHLEALLAHIAELRTLRAQNEGLTMDAGRYRWLREKESEHGVSVVSIAQWVSAATCIAVTFVDGSFVDHAIDTAMQAQK